MTWRSARRGAADAQGRIPLLAAVLGLLWNASALIVFGWHDFGLGELSPWFTALAYSALGFLPAVVVDSATRTPSPQRTSRPGRLALFAYGLSAIGGVLQAVAVVRGGGVSTAGLLTLTLGYAVVILIFALSARRRRESPKTLAAVALAAFAVSALHLSHHSSANESWVVELIGHHASLPLVLVIRAGRDRGGSVRDAHRAAAGAQCRPASHRHSRRPAHRVDRNRASVSTPPPRDRSIRRARGAPSGGLPRPAAFGGPRTLGRRDAWRRSRCDVQAARFGALCARRSLAREHDAGGRGARGSARRRPWANERHVAGADDRRALVYDRRSDAR